MHLHIKDFLDMHLHIKEIFSTMTAAFELKFGGTAGLVNS
jgi:hypothetical protein